jgi:FixJ family two-component response regulator
MNPMNALVCVVDDDPSVCRSLVRLLESEGFAAEGYASAQAYLDRPVPQGPSCLVLDKLMPGVTGLDLQQLLIARGREEHVVFITGDRDIPSSVQAMKAGAIDFLPKPFKTREFLDAISRAVARSETRWQQRTDRERARAQLALLTQREQQVLKGVIAGRMNKEIAADLGTSVRTIKVQRGNMMRKAGVTSVAELVRLTHRAGSHPPIP